MTVFILEEYEPEHSEYPHMIRGVFANEWLAAKVAKELVEEAEKDHPEWIRRTDSEWEPLMVNGLEVGGDIMLWWTITEHEVENGGVV